MIAPVWLAPAHAEAVLSDRLTDQIVLMQRLEINRQLDAEYEKTKTALGTQATPDGAAKLRELLVNHASVHELFEEIDRAEADFDALLQIEPLDPMIYVDRGYFYMRQRRFSEALRDFMTGSRLAPTVAVFNYGAGRALTRMRAYADATEQYSEAMRLTPNDSVPVMSRAEVYVQLGRYAEARADYDRALALGLRRDMDRFFVYFGRGYSSIFVGDYVGAVSNMDAALAARPGMVNAVVWRGYAHEKLGQRARALDDYEAALRMNPNDDWILSSIRRMRS